MIRVGGRKSAISSDSGKPGVTEDLSILPHGLRISPHLVPGESSLANAAIKLQSPARDTRRQSRPGRKFQIEKVKGVEMNGQARGMTKIPSFTKGTKNFQGRILRKASPKLFMKLSGLSGGIQQGFGTFCGNLVLPGIQKGLYPIHKTGNALLERLHFETGQKIVCEKGRRHTITSVPLR